MSDNKNLREVIVSFRGTVIVDVTDALDPDEYALREAKRLVSEKFYNEGSKMFNYLIEE